MDGSGVCEVRAEAKETDAEKSDMAAEEKETSAVKDDPAAEKT